MWSPSGGCLQVKPDSTVQVDEQPSPETLLLSSQASAPSFLPSPHLVAWHSVGGLPVQAQPGAQRQFAVQALSMLAILTAGSHCSVPITMPSPQLGTQGALRSGQT